MKHKVISNETNLYVTRLQIKVTSPVVTCILLLLFDDVQNLHAGAIQTVEIFKIKKKKTNLITIKSVC